MLEKIVNRYCIQQISDNYTDILVDRDNFISAVQEINKLGCFVVEICWWCHNKIDETPNTFSMGGPIDIRNEKYFFGETNFSKSFKINNLKANLKQLLEYYVEFIKKDKYNLYPSITIEL